MKTENLIENKKESFSKKSSIILCIYIISVKQVTVFDGQISTCWSRQFILVDFHER